MITMKEWMDLVDCKITDGSNYTWNCYGDNAYQLSSWNGIHDKGGYSLSIVFSTKSQKVYQVEVCDYTNDRAYRMIHPDKVEKFKKEAKNRNVNPYEAWDNINFIDLEVDEDFVEKATAIVAGKEYDTGVMIELDLPDDLILSAAKEAHKQNITLNAYINQALASMAEVYKAEGRYKGKDI